MIDFKITDDFDLSFASNGDFNTVNDIETAIPCAMFLEARDTDATQSFIIGKPNAARGHFGMTEGEGSLLWKLDQARLSTNVINEARLFATNGLQFLQDDEVVDTVSVASSYNGSAIILNVQIENGNSTIERSFKL